MNVIISNKYTEMLSELTEIEVIKRLEGTFSVDDIIEQFKNFFFERMILDITAIKDYQDIKNLQKLSISLDTTKIILVLDDTNDTEMNVFLSQIISMGIYNFTRNLEGIRYLLQHPNQYRDVAHIHNLGNAAMATVGAVAASGGKDVYIQSGSGTIVHTGTKIIGVKNITEHAGATTLINVMKRELSAHYSVMAVEVDKMDFLYFGDPKMISTSKGGLATELMKHRDVDIILVDMNESTDYSVCNEILYLVQPSILKLNKMVKRDKRIAERLSGKKVILNQSLLDRKDIDNLEYDTRINFFANIPPIDDRSGHIVPINNLLVQLGFGAQGDPEQTSNSGEGSSGGAGGLLEGVMGFFKK